MQDLIQEGNIGLMKAIEKFGPGATASLLMRLGGYARRCRELFPTRAASIRVPMHMGDKIRKMAHCCKVLFCRARS